MLPLTRSFHYLIQIQNEFEVFSLILIRFLVTVNMRIYVSI